MYQSIEDIEKLLIQSHISGHVATVLFEDALYYVIMNFSIVHLLLRKRNETMNCKVENKLRCLNKIHQYSQLIG